MTEKDLRAIILAVLEDNQSLCCDDEDDRNALSDAIAYELTFHIGLADY